MQKISKILISSLILIVALTAVFALSANAETTAISQAQSEAITSNCTTLKATLTQLHSNDALLRVNAGQTYESILTKLMKRFNERVAYNNMDHSGLDTVALNFETTLNVFRSDYVTYEQQLSEVMDIDCSTSPQGFYDAVMLTKTYRSKVREDVNSLNTIMNQYSTALDKFEVDNKSLIERLSK